MRAVTVLVLLVPLLAHAKETTSRAAAAKAARQAYGPGAKISRQPMFQSGTTNWMAGAQAFRVRGTNQAIVVQGSGKRLRTFTADVLHLDPRRSPDTIQLKTSNPIVILRTQPSALVMALPEFEATGQNATSSLMNLGASFTKRHTYKSMIFSEPVAEKQRLEMSSTIGDGRERVQHLEIEYTPSPASSKQSPLRR
jgi:hypothetical protein